MKRINLICVVVVSAMLLTNYKKNENDSLPLNNNSENQASGADGKWDVLGYGMDATQDMLITNSMSDVCIFDIEQFAVDFRNKNNPDKVNGIEVNSVTTGSYDILTGSSAYDYSKNVSNKKSYGGNGNNSVPYSTDPSVKEKKLLNFTASFSKNTEDHNNTTVSSRFSYATFEMWHRVKRIYFTEDVSTSTLLKYLTPEFKII